MKKNEQKSKRTRSGLMSMVRHLTKGRDITLKVSMIGILLTLLLGVFNYLGPIKTNIEQIPTIATGISSIKTNTDQIPTIATGISYLRGTADALFSKNEGGTLTSLGTRTTMVTTKSEDVINDAILKYVPVSLETQPAAPPPGVTVTGYGFVLLPYSLSNVQVPESPFKEARLTIIYTEDDLQLAGGNPENLIILCWDKQLGKWRPLPTTVEGRQLSAIIKEPTWFMLTAS